MPRSIWRGAISFGMVSIPVRLFTATDSKDIAFRQLHDADGHSRIRQLRWCPVHDREVELSEIVRGYEYSKDRYVILDNEDFEKLPLPSRHTIELSAFVRADEIDPIHYERSYYLEPEETGAKPFALLMRALREKDLTAIAKIAIRNKERLCALRPQDGALTLETLYMADEIREAPEEVPWHDIDVSDAEMEMAFTLIDMLQKPFDAGEYHDDYREALMEVINAKLEGQELVEIEAAAPAKVIDLMEALKASVEATKQSRAAASDEQPSRRRKSRAKAS